MPPIVSEEYKERMRSKILKSALECFAQKGFETTTVDDIGAHSGISKGSIYTYFDSKESIYLELLNKATDNDKEDITQNFAKRRSAYSKINFMFDVFLALDPFNPDRLGKTVVFYEFTFHCTRSEKLLDVITERGNFLINLIKETLEEGQEQGEIDKNIDTNLYAHKFWLIIDGASLQTIYKDFPYYEVLREMKEMYLEEIKKR
ncbi:TetR/AcrR family transcriptional regulator [Bacillus sp. S/N-304-OC-R1]|uniref:TetR/AcrR family transcriptional regulator n=1 Tax=Bacillus sp. S/N-304-OC-R1 TaxID=2758034 RepID=UPI001C8D20F8|nr:TetR/AcrR family transcriptional regulator [Bacillus sp. S/N-304-OC-R1]MBY0122803.1 TetR/AcrR family transcriptional regulator [Bacillus sp. S/N-304-OC-R1]